MSDTRKIQGKPDGRGKHPNSRKNLEKGIWKPGESGNPEGKPQGAKNRSTVLQKWVELTVTFSNTNKKGEKVFKDLDQNIAITVEDELALALIGEGRNGNVTAIREINDSLYGKAAQSMDVTSNGKDLIPSTFEHKLKVIFGESDDDDDDK